MIYIARRVIQTHGLQRLWRGFSMTAAREGIFCCAYISSSPLLSRTFQEHCSMSSGLASISGAIVAGSIAAVLTHPADTLKTRMQGDLFAPDGSGYIRNANLRTVVTEMVQLGDGAGGALRHCFAGFTPRLLRIVACTFIYGQLNYAFSNLVADHL